MIRQKAALLSTLVVAAAWGATTLIRPFVEPGMFPFFLAAAAFATWRGGPLLGTVALLVGSLIADYQFLEPLRTIDMDRLTVLHLLPFWTSGAIVIALIEQLRRANRLADVRATHMQQLTEDRHQAQQQVQQSERRFRDLADAAPALIWLCDPAGQYLYFNKPWLEFTGHSMEEEQGTWLDHVHPNDRATREAAFNEAFEKRASFKVEYRLQRADGQYRWLVEHGRPVEGVGDAFEGFVGACVDITERWMAEEQLRQSQKMEAIGQLAGGVAHDFNNILMTILTSVEFLLQEAQPASTIAQDALEIKKAASRAGDLTRQLLSFSRKEVVQPRVLALHPVLHDILPMLRRLIPEDIHVAIGGQAVLGLVRTDPSQMEQVILNLTVNARDAMPSGGRLQFNVEDVYEDGGTGVPRGRYTLFTVQDTGAGMDLATQARIFEPFFTTKRVGSGTGLGLSTVYGAVKQCGGFIYVDSALGHGTTFRMYFPAPLAPEEVARSEVLDLPLPPTGSENLLIVEDEEPLRRLICRMLTNYGYQVHAAENGRDALALLETGSFSIQLVVTDIVMPEMGGRELGQHIADRWPELPVIYMSSYTNDEVFRRGLENHQNVFLSKPFALEALIHKIQEVLILPIQRGTP